MISFKDHMIKQAEVDKVHSRTRYLYLDAVSKVVQKDPIRKHDLLADVVSSIDDDGHIYLYIDFNQGVSYRGWYEPTKTKAKALADLILQQDPRLQKVFTGIGIPTMYDRRLWLPGFKLV